MSASPEDELETLLRECFDGPVADAGFSDRIIRSLPPRRRRILWPRWVGIAAGAIVCGLALARSPLLRAGWLDSVQGIWSAPAIALTTSTLLMSVLALAWAMAEADRP